jgi:hypothetical protein
MISSPSLQPHRSQNKYIPNLDSCAMSTMVHQKGYCAHNINEWLEFDTTKLTTPPEASTGRRSLISPSLMAWMAGKNLTWRVRSRGQRADDSARSSLSQETWSSCDRLGRPKERRTDWRQAQHAGLIDISSGVHQSSACGNVAGSERGESKMPVISNSCVECKDERLTASIAGTPYG